MPIDLADVREGLSNTVPMIATLGITFEDLSYDRAVLVLPDAVEYHNHIGGLHAGAMFTLAESATAAIIFANFGDIPDVVTPLAMEATIRYLKVAMGPVTAVATMETSRDEILQTIAEGRRPEFTIAIELSTGAGADRLVTGAMSVLWTLRLVRRDSDA
jgi:uncharacterized protein (TIGR00369 family)